MEYNNFAQIREAARRLSIRKRGIVVGAEDRHVLSAVFEAEKQGLTSPILTGNKDRIVDLIESLGYDQEKALTLDVPSGENPALRAVELLNQGKADFLIKGKIETKDLLKPVVDRKNNLHQDLEGSSGIMSHLSFLEIPGIPKLVTVTDGGMVIYPDLNKKKAILFNAFSTLLRMGYEKPKAAILCAVEKVNENMQETIDASALAAMSGTDLFAQCSIEGPISYDIAMNAAIAEIKGYKSSNCGNFDVLLVPDLACGNILVKSLTVTAGASMAGLIVGAKIPIVLTSRGSSADEKLNSIALSALTSAKHIESCKEL